jgi:hypothetical protein
MTSTRRLSLRGIAKEQLTLQELMAEKDRVEAELKALGQVLDSVRKSGL